MNRIVSSDYYNPLYYVDLASNVELLIPEYYKIPNDGSYGLIHRLVEDNIFLKLQPLTQAMLMRDLLGERDEMNYLVTHTIISTVPQQFMKYQNVLKAEANFCCLSELKDVFDDMEYDSLTSAMLISKTVMFLAKNADEAYKIKYLPIGGEITYLEEYDYFGLL